MRTPEKSKKVSPNSGGGGREEDISFRRLESQATPGEGGEEKVFSLWKRKGKGVDREWASAKKGKREGLASRDENRSSWLRMMRKRQRRGANLRRIADKGGAKCWSTRCGGVRYSSKISEKGGSEGLQAGNRGGLRIGGGTRRKGKV